MGNDSFGGYCGSASASCTQSTATVRMGAEEAGGRAGGWTALGEAAGPTGAHGCPGLPTACCPSIREIPSGSWLLTGDSASLCLRALLGSVGPLRAEAASPHRPEGAGGPAVLPAAAGLCCHPAAGRPEGPGAAERGGALPLRVRPAGPQASGQVGTWTCSCLAGSRRLPTLFPRGPSGQHARRQAGRKGWSNTTPLSQVSKGCGGWGSTERRRRRSSKGRGDAERTERVNRREERTVSTQEASVGGGGQEGARAGGPGSGRALP